MTKVDADEPELLADDREDHVGVRLGEVRDLPDALAQTGAREAARADADRGLHDLEARALGVRPRMQEAEEAGATIWLEPDRERSDRRVAARVAVTRSLAGTPATRRIASIIPQSVIVVPRSGSTTISAQKIPVSEPERLHELAERAGRAPAREIHGREQAERELRELGRLEAGRPEDEPAARAVDRRPEDEDGRAQPERDEQERRSEIAETVVVEARGHDHEHEPDEGVHRLPLEVAHRVAVPDRRRRGRRAVHHDEPERDESERDERDESLIRGAVALHASASTSSRNASPRASKSRNWS